MKWPSRLRNCFHLSSKNTEKIILFGEALLLTVLCLFLLLPEKDPEQAALSKNSRSNSPFGLFRSEDSEKKADSDKDFIKWVDFDVTCQAMNQAFRYDVDTCQSDIHLNWVELLAYLGARYGGDFSRYKPEHMTAAAEKLKSGEITMEELTKELKYYSYYQEAYSAVLGGMVGEFQAEIPSSEAPAAYLPSGVAGGTESDPETIWVTKYGLKAFFPLAKGFPYSDYDDFGAARSYGFKRQHLGHDMMGQVGSPVIAVESGYVEAIGWNQYGGWRLGIRSFDKKRYYYYAHLRKNYPYQSCLKEGSIVQAGDVIGYLGRTGYSRTENTNNIDEPHLHFGLELIFDESQKDSNHEIWIDCYELVKFLKLNQCETVKVEGTKEWTRVYQTKDPAVPEAGT
ncbi:MAG: M23 family metallopeptidase [Enterocloster sp.]